MANKPGRPTKLTPEVQEKIITAIRAGNYMETAAAYAGISKQSLYYWLKQGAEGKSEMHKAFSDAVKKALAEAEMRDVMTIGAAAKEVWQAAAWRLERKYPERWGRWSKVSVSILESQEWQTLTGILLDVLSKYPEAAEEAKRAIDGYIGEHAKSAGSLQNRN